MIAVIAGGRSCMMMMVILIKRMMMKRRMRRILLVHDSCDGSEPQVHEAPGNPFSRLSSNPPLCSNMGKRNPEWKVFGNFWSMIVEDILIFGLK